MYFSGRGARLGGGGCVLQSGLSNGHGTHLGRYTLSSNFAMYTRLVTLTSYIIIYICVLELIADAFWLCFVSMLWGSTNPLIRKGSKGIEDIHRSGRIRQFFADIFFLASNWKVRRISTSTEFCINYSILP